VDKTDLVYWKRSISYFHYTINTNNFQYILRFIAKQSLSLKGTDTKQRLIQNIIMKELYRGDDEPDWNG